MNKLYRYLFFMLMPALVMLTVSCQQETEPTPEPQITQIYPAAATPASLVAITGLNVQAASSVTFGDTQATIVDVTGNTVLVNVPEGLAPGTLMVTVDAPGGAYGHPFKVLDPARSATFTAISPATAGVGTEVVLTGTNLAGATALLIGNTEIAEFEVNDAGTSITFVVPRSAYFNPFSGTFAVTTPNGTFYSPVNVRFDLIQTAKVLVALTTEDPFVLSGFGETVVLTAQLTGSEEDLATVEKVVFMEGTTVLSEVTTAPYVHEFQVAAEVAPYTNFNITALAYDTDGNLIMDSEVLKIRVGERIPVSGGTLTGTGDERWNTDGPRTPPFPADGTYAGMMNFDGAGSLEAASGVNLPVTLPEGGKYIASLGLASGWAAAESFMYLYFNDQLNTAQRSAEVPPTGWIDFHDYMLANPFQLEAGEQTAKIRFGGPFVHPYYLDMYRL